MALQLQTDLGNGFSGNYYKISSVRIDRDASTIMVMLSLFMTQEARTEGLKPVSAMSFNLSGVNFTTAMAASNLVQALYDFAKLQPQFTGNIDC